MGEIEAERGWIMNGERRAAGRAEKATGAAGSLVFPTKSWAHRVSAVPCNNFLVNHGRRHMVRELALVRQNSICLASSSSYIGISEEEVVRLRK